MDEVIHEEILEKIRNEFPHAVKDGAVDWNRYAATNLRLLWVLREVHDGNIARGGEGGGWDLRRFLREDLLNYPRWHVTYGAVAKVSNALSQGVAPADVACMSSRNVIGTLKEIAVINLNKLGGKARVETGGFKEHIRQFSPFISRQVEALAPHVIIAGGTYDLLSEYSCGGASIATSQKFGATISGDRWLVKAYHPGQTKLKDHVYYERIENSLREAGWAGNTCATAKARKTQSL